MAPVQVWVSTPDIVVFEMVQDSVLVEAVDMATWVKKTERPGLVLWLIAIKRAMKMEVEMSTETWSAIGLIERKQKGLKE